MKSSVSRRNFVKAAALPAIVPLTGCQFLFPTPIDQEVNTRVPSEVVRAVGTPYFVGEVIKAEIVLDSIIAGTGELRVEEFCTTQKKRAVRVKTVGGTTGLLKFLQTVESTAETIVDLETSLPLQSRSDSLIGEKRQQIDIAYGPGKYRLRQVKTDPAKKKPSTVYAERALVGDQPPHDSHSLLGYIRNWRPPAGTRGHVHVIVGRYPWRLDLVFVGPEEIEREQGKAKTVRVDGVGVKLIGKNLVASEKTPKRPFTMWISDDPRKVPLRVLLETDIAKVTVELTEYKRSEGAEPSFDPKCTEVADARAIDQGIREKARKKAEPQPEPRPDDEPSEPQPDDERDERDAIDRILKGD